MLRLGLGLSLWLARPGVGGIITSHSLRFNQPKNSGYLALISEDF